jgi:hypothetical protein
MNNLKEKEEYLLKKLDRLMDKGSNDEKIVDKLREVQKQIREKKNEDTDK